LSPNVTDRLGVALLTVGHAVDIQVTLGQDYLPNRVGTASGVSLGLAITVSGLLAPIFGVLADATSLRLTLTVLIALPVLALLLTATMRDPRPRSPEPAAGATAAAVGRAGSGRTGRGR
jgi:FSR family fosmidomycin resistance protein-like MFS transporter